MKMIFKVLILFCFLRKTVQHGRMLEPPSRASMWRLGFPAPVDQNDHECYCGGFGVQHYRNSGKCGICGDAFDAKPRQHEAPDGAFATGIITKNYNQGSYIPVVIDLTANHQGYFEFKICPNDNIFQDPDQSCFDTHGPLWVGGGDPDYQHKRHPIDDYITGLRLLYVRLPLNVTCDQCILQWTYIAGNNWGTCKDGTAGMGCGPQETFRACADIKISPHPLLSSLIKTKELPENDDDFFDGFVVENGEIDDSYEDDLAELDNEHKEALLRKKKILLEKVLQKIRILMNSVDLESNPANKPQTKSDRYQDLDEISSDTSEKLRKENDEIRSPRHDTLPWWERIVSNRH